MPTTNLQTRRSMWSMWFAGAISLAALTQRVDAFCGFYIDTGGAEMFNDATHVVLMREGTRTVLAMANNYQGPLQDFAMVIPVPTVLSQGDVKTLPKSLLQKVNAMSAPRLVEYWEEDPCNVWRPEGQSIDARDFAKHAEPAEKYGVTIEKQFDVDEYKIVILSAKDSTGLDSYLRAEKYKLPAGAAPLLRPYVEAGSKWFVARVDPKKVRFVKGRAELSPIRFHYDSEEFSLPIRLGLANSSGTQDLIVEILAPDTRYEVANYPNAFIPTNIQVKDEVRNRFGEFYAALFDRTVQQHPGAVITEYSWAASSCDPCPGPRLWEDDFLPLGQEVLIPKPVPPPPPPRDPSVKPDEIELEDEIDLFGPQYRDFVLTRLHARYSRDNAPRDLVFRVAPPVSGGRERWERIDEASPPYLPTVASASSANSFQARYIIRHPWTQPVQCEAPVRNHWGGPDGRRPSKTTAASAMDPAFAPRGQIALHDVVAQDIPEIAVQQGVPLSPPLPGPAERRVKAKGCGGCGAGDGALGAGLGLGLLALLRRRR